MVEDIEERLDRLQYLMEELEEERQHLKDLRIENELLVVDFLAIRATPNTRKIKLYMNYFS